MKCKTPLLSSASSSNNIKLCLMATEHVMLELRAHTISHIYLSYLFFTLISIYTHFNNVNTVYAAAASTPYAL